MPVKYKLQPVSPEAHLYEVELHLSNPNSAGQLLRLPNWIPGSYMIRDFSKNITEIVASSNGQEIELQKIDKATWQAPAGLTQLSIFTRVYAWDLSVRSAHLDNTHAFFNGTSVFLAPVGQEWEPVSIELSGPPGDAFKKWQLATAMQQVNVDENGFGEFTAANYDELIDHPVEMGEFTRIAFDACGVVHEVVLTGSIHTDLDRIAKDLKQICEYQIRFFGEPAPVEKYVFLVMVVGAGYGGLEHRASTALLITRDHLPITDDSTTSKKYIDFLGLCSHEYFHTWNVKRIKPAAFVPYQLEAESYTKLLWFFEGITSYYDDLILLRCGLITEGQYLDLLAKTVTRIQRGEGRRIQSVTDSSFDAWNKFYKQDENAPNAIVSYYAKGALISLCLDAEIRRLTAGEKSLDDLMQQVWKRWLQTGNGLAESEPESVAAHITGNDMRAFFDRALYSTEELPLAESLGELGVELQWRARTSVTDLGGGKVDTDDDQLEAVSPWLGANISGAEGRIVVSHVFRGGAAESAGLAAGDIIVAVQDLVVSADALPDVLKRFASLASVTVHYIRHGVLGVATLPIYELPIDTCSLVRRTDSKTAWPFVTPYS